MYDVPDTVDLLFNMDQQCDMIIIQHGQITDNNHIYVVLLWTCVVFLNEYFT